MDVLRTKLSIVIALFLLGAVLPTGAQEVRSLAGRWTFRSDSLNVGLRQQWFNEAFDMDVTLPGTLDEVGFGSPPTVSVDTPSREVLLKLARKHTYIGPAWYSREVVIPHHWASQHVELLLERVIWNTRVWVNGREAGTGESLSTPHHFNVGSLLKPGKNRITIRVDNRKQYDITHRDMAHAYTEGTQVVWNGIIGKIELTAREKLRLGSVQLYPSYKEQSVQVSAALHNDLPQPRLARLLIQIFLKGRPVASRQLTLKIPPGKTTQKQTLSIKNAVPWDEFHHNLYTVTVQLLDNRSGKKDGTSAQFGMRDLSSQNGLLQVNGHRVFLRGTLECAIFPLTGYPPMDKQGWLKVFTMARAYGLNHIRFHSWCPPKAAFAVADSLGFYLQVELPFWSEKLGGAVLDEPSRRFIEYEAARITEEYGNHPSFCLWSMGNEIRGDFAWLSRLVTDLKQKDARHLYAATTFTFDKGHGKWPEPVDDFFVTQYTEKGWVRGQGIFNTVAPDFATDYSKAIDSVPVPLISHEIGQYSIYPDLEQMGKYTGVLAPLNFETIRRDLQKKNLLPFNTRFAQASGRFAARLYKEEIERALKTRGMSGFQLLDLHDFPGQGTALVGILDAFWDSKGMVTPEEHRMYCGPVVPLLRFSKAAYTTAERFEATAEVANFGNGVLKNTTPLWSVIDPQGTVLFSGRLKGGDIALGNGHQLGSIAFELNGLSKATQLTLTLELKGTEYKNKWSIWVYPEGPAVRKSEVLFTTSLEVAFQLLRQGKKVLLNPDTASIRGVEGRFAPVFWSPVHFPKQPGTMGVLCDPAHPALAHFPTEAHSNWQWWDLITASKTMVLDSLPGLQPVVRVVDNFLKNRKMANIIEARVGEGQLLLISMDITRDLDKRPAARQLRYSLTRYMESPAFTPSVKLTAEQLRYLVKSERDG